MQATQRYIVFLYMILGVLLWISLSKLMAVEVYAMDVSDPQIIGSNFTLTTMVGMVIALVAGIVADRHPRAQEFSIEVVVELRKVTWPTKKETKSATIVVLVTTLIIATILGLFDFVWAELTGIIYSAK